MNVHNIDINVPADYRADSTLSTMSTVLIIDGTRQRNHIGALAVASYARLHGDILKNSVELGEYVVNI